MKIHRVSNPLPGRKQNLTGQTFGLLQVDSEVGRNKHNNILWLCKCKCGRTTKATTTDLKCGRKTSCGCNRYRSGSAVYNWTGHGEMSGSYLYTVKCNAKSRNLAFEVAAEELWNLFLNQGRHCAVSGLPMCFGEERTASLDRIDCKQGYITGNIQWVHKDINIMRNKYPVSYFVDMCRVVVAYQSEKE